jgi:predicted ATPase/DNA-binding SARP family transcriptional activator
VGGPTEQLDVRILGPLEVVSGGSSLTLGGQKQRAVLAILATRANTVVSADELIEWLWSESPPATATTTVQVYVSRLRKLIGADHIATTGGGYVLRIEPDQLDRARFDQLAARGRELRKADEPMKASAALADALSLWRGPALADFAYESWAQSDIARLEEQRISCLEERLEADLACGRDSDLVGELEALVVAHPLRERLRGQLMLALYRAGRQAEALEAYQEARSTLVDELGIEPSPELQELNRKILTQEIESVAPPSHTRMPTGTVTLLATDIEASTQLLSELGPLEYAEALAEHRRMLRSVFAAYDGVEVDTQGDAFLIAFARASDAVAAASEAQRGLRGGQFRVRMGLHSGEPLLTAEGYVGIDVHQAARVVSAGHGGQVLISQATQALLDSSVELLDLGDHRLKDLTAAQRLYQLGAEHFPPLKTLHQTNLPVQPTPFIGRKEELAQVLELLSHARLVTLTGAGGSGKTRLALQAAAELVEAYQQGIWWIALAALKDPDLVEPTIARVVGAKNGVAEHLRGQKTLLLLDNFEHLLDAAPRISALLSEAPDVRVLTTSRERLGIAAEQEYSVPTLVDAEAVALFIARARQLKPDFQPDSAVNEICRRLDGLPLAIELAAARTKVLAPDQILKRLGRSLDLLTVGARDSPERQRTLRATIEWSYDLLDDAESHLFASLAVFAGSFSLEAAEEVCGAELDTLASLVDKSLLRERAYAWGEPRFSMLETVREYALERLEEGGSAQESRQRQAAYFLELAERAEPEIWGPKQEAWFERLEREHGNLWAALSWSIESGDAESALRVAGALEPFWEARGHIAEGRRWLAEALATAPASAAAVRAKALFGASRLAGIHGELAYEQELLEESVALHSKGDDQRGLIFSLSHLGSVSFWRGDKERGRALGEESVELARELGDKWSLGMALNNFGCTLMEDGDSVRARQLMEESLHLRREIGEKRGVAVSASSLAELALSEADGERATPLLEEALVLAHDLRYLPFIADGLAHLGLARVHERDYEHARSLFEESLERCQDMGNKKTASLCLSGLAAVAAAHGEALRAARLWGAAAALREETGTGPSPPERSLDERCLATARAGLGEQAWRAAAAGEQAMARTLDQAVAYALEAAPTAGLPDDGHQSQ